MTGPARYLRAAGSILAYRADTHRWRRQIARFPRDRRASRPGPVLYCDVVGSYAVSKAQSLFAVAFRQLGYDGVVLLDRPNGDIERCYRAAGINRFEYLEDISPDPATYRARAEELVSGYDDLNDILPLEIDNARVGRNVLSKVVRQFRVGRLDAGNRDHRDATIDTLCQSLAAIDGARTLLERIGPKAAFFCERGYTPAGEIFDLCATSGIDAIHWAGAPMDGTLLFKRYGAANRAMHPLSLSEESWTRIRNEPWSGKQDEDLLNQIASHYHSGAWYNRQQLQDGKTIQNRRQVESELGLDPAKKTAVIFSHILYDATFFYGDSLFDDYQTWLVETVRCAIANPALNWIVKAHPVNVWRSRMDGVAVEPLELNAIHEACGALPDHVHFMPADTPINTYSLFDAADYGLTVRGTIGLELPCFGIPVVTAGSGRYSGHGFTIDPESPAEYRSLLATLQDVPPLDERMTTLARRYAYATLRWRPLPLTSFEYQFGLTSRLAPNMKSNVRIAKTVPADLTSTPDLGRMAHWVMESPAEDLLAPESDDGLDPTHGSVRAAPEDAPEPPARAAR